MKQIVLLLVCFLLSTQLFSQIDADTQLAADYFQKKEFDKALTLYQKLFQQSNSRTYFDFVVQCSVELKQFDDAEKTIKKQAKKDNTDLTYFVLLGKTYTAAGNTDKAKQAYKNAVDKLTNNLSQILALGAAFEKELDFEQAVAVYKKGQKLLGETYMFHNELANAYLITHNNASVADEYMALLDENPNMLPVIESRIQGVIFNETENTLRETLKTKLIQQLQRSAASKTFANFLIWIFVQEKDFTNAFVQAKAIDKREKENGERLLEIGDMAVSNVDFDDAVRCYQYVVDKGKENDLYIDAKSKLLTTLNQKILQNPAHTKKEELELEQMMHETVSQNRVPVKTYPILIALAHLQAFYLNKADSATKELEDALLNVTLTLDNKSDIRMELGGIYLSTDDIWDANLTLAKVESDKAGNPIAHEAKLQRARLAYFSGDFEWAEALLSILKAATSEATANDAFELWWLINDNSQDDTLHKALTVFSRADFLLYKGKDSLALLIYDSIPKQFPGSSLEDVTLFRKAKIYIKQQQFDLATKNLQTIIDRFSDNIYADDALFLLAQLNETHYQNKEKAMELYRKLINDFSGSIYVIEARTRLRLLRGDGIK